MSGRLQAVGTGVNAAVAFALELFTLGCVAWWAYTSTTPRWLGLLTAIVLPSAMGVAWGLVAAPRARHPLHGAARTAFQAAWFGIAVVILIARHHTAFGVVLACVIAANLTAAAAWRQG
ncbi:MAG: YrdB family protein [Acidimicrobiales bacterium]